MLIVIALQLRTCPKGFGRCFRLNLSLRVDFILYCLYVESKKKMLQMNLYTKHKYTHRHRRQTYGYQRGNGGGGVINCEFEISIYIVLYIE